MKLGSDISRRIARWVGQRGAESGPAQVGGLHAISGYLALSRLPGVPHTLETRIVLLTARLAAELSGCPWCIERCRHDCRVAGLSGHVILTEREQAALTFVHAVARSRDGAEPPCEGALQRARGWLSETELADVTALVEEYHCLESFNLNHYRS